MKKRYLRKAGRFLSLALAFWLVLFASGAVPGLSAISPFVAVGSLLAVRTLSWTMLYALPLLLLFLAGKRLFCRFLCPFGCLTEGVGGKRGSKANRYVPRIGAMLLAATWVGGIFGLPFFLFLDPLVLFATLFQHNAFYWLALIPVGVLLFSVLFPGLWCAKVCPLGATQDLLGLPSRQLQRYRKKNKPESETSLPSRRTFFANVAGLALLAPLVYCGIAWTKRLRGSPLRPPGACSEDAFQLLCVRCGRCIEECPTGLLVADLNTDPPTLAGLPIAQFDPAYCKEGCNACTQVCPSGAIERLTLAEKERTPLGVAQVDRKLCKLGFDEECSLCKQECPHGAITLAWSEEEYLAHVEIDAEKCIGCGKCVKHCIGTNFWETEADPTVSQRKALKIV